MSACRWALLVAPSLCVGCTYDVSLGAPGQGTSVDLREPLDPGDPGVADLQFVVRADGRQRPISPLIYGSWHLSSGVGATVVVKTGIRWIAYNWENNASNAGKDYPEGQNDGFMSESDVPGESMRPALLQAADLGTSVVLQLNTGDRVSADKAPLGDVRDSGPDYLDTRFVRNYAQKPTALSTTPDPNDEAVYQDEMVYWATQTVPGAHVLFALDDVPDLWPDHHPELYSSTPSYDEVVGRQLTFAAAAKDVAPSAPILALNSWGWSGWWHLEDAGEPNADFATKGVFFEYYLAEAARAEATAGRRLIDQICVHYESEAHGDEGRVTVSEGSAAARVQAPRSLWDPSYVEESWVSDLYGPLNLLPRLQAMIDAAYPGTGLCLSTYDFGGGGDVSGAIAVADTLGLLGVHGVTTAAMDVNSEDFKWAGLAAYRNYDGAGSTFGDRSIAVDTTDTEQASCYASLDAGNPNRLVIVAINKAETQATAGIQLMHPTSFSELYVYAITGSVADVLPFGTVPAVGTNAFRYTMPALSVSVLVPH